MILTGSTTHKTINPFIIGNDHSPDRLISALVGQLLLSLTIRPRSAGDGISNSSGHLADHERLGTPTRRLCKQRTSAQRLSDCTNRPVVQCLILVSVSLQVSTMFSYSHGPKCTTRVLIPGKKVARSKTAVDMAAASDIVACGSTAPKIIVT